MSRAKMGSSAVAEEKKVARKSSSMLGKMIGWRMTKRSPSPAASRKVAERLASGQCQRRRVEFALLADAAHQDQGRQHGASTTGR